MLSERLRRRLEQMQCEAPPVERRMTEVPRGEWDVAALAGEEADSEWGPYWLLRQPIEVLWPSAQHYLPEVFAAVGRAVSETDPHGESDIRLNAVPDELIALRHSFPRRQVYLDLETCGLSGAMIFLIGLLHWHGDRLVLSQLWARNYAEEPAILGSLAALLTDRDLLVTFNGKSFDWPLVRDRRTRHHLPHTDPRHVDLLHHARRRWRGSLPNCRLQTLEQYICGRHRVDDVPGHEIPQAYHDYVRSGNTARMHSILHHNALDLVTLLQLGLIFVRQSE